MSHIPLTIGVSFQVYTISQRFHLTDSVLNYKKHLHVKREASQHPSGSWPHSTPTCLSTRGAGNIHRRATSWGACHTSLRWHTVNRKPDTKTEGRMLSFRIRSKRSGRKSNVKRNASSIRGKHKGEEQKKKSVGKIFTFSMAFNSVGLALPGGSACKTISKHFMNTTFIHNKSTQRPTLIQASLELRSEALVQAFSFRKYVNIFNKDKFSSIHFVLEMYSWSSSNVYQNKYDKLQVH